MKSPVIEEFCYRRDVFNEDIHLVQYLSGGVIRALVGDGVAEYHSPKRPRRVITLDGEPMDSAQLVGCLVLGYMLDTPSYVSLRELLQQTNRAVGIALAEHGFPIDFAADLPGMDVAAVKLQDDGIEVVQCGDSLAMWELVGGAVDGTPNQVWPIESARQPIAQRLREEGVMGGAIWDHPEWEKIYRQHRALYKNKRGTQYANATINGQEGFNDLLYHKILPTDQVRRILLITDGMVDYNSTSDVPGLAARLFTWYDEVGLRGIAEKKEFERIKEATAIVIDLR